MFFLKNKNGEFSKIRIAVSSLFLVICIAFISVVWFETTGIKFAEKDIDGNGKNAVIAKSNDGSTIDIVYLGHNNLNTSSSIKYVSFKVTYDGKKPTCGYITENGPKETNQYDVSFSELYFAEDLNGGLTHFEDILTFQENDINLNITFYGCDSKGNMNDVVLTRGNLDGSKLEGSTVDEKFKSFTAPEITYTTSEITEDGKTFVKYDITLNSVNGITGYTIDWNDVDFAKGGLDENKIFDSPKENYSFSRKLEKKYLPEANETISLNNYPYVEILTVKDVYGNSNKVLLYPGTSNHDGIYCASYNGNNVTEVEKDQSKVGQIICYTNNKFGSKLPKINIVENDLKKYADHNIVYTTPIGDNAIIYTYKITGLKEGKTGFKIDSKIVDEKGNGIINKDDVYNYEVTKTDNSPEINSVSYKFGNTTLNKFDDTYLSSNSTFDIVFKITGELKTVKKINASSKMTFGKNMTSNKVEKILSFKDVVYKYDKTNNITTVTFSYKVVGYGITNIEFNKSLFTSNSGVTIDSNYETDDIIHIKDDTYPTCNVSVSKKEISVGDKFSVDLSCKSNNGKNLLSTSKSISLRTSNSGMVSQDGITFPLKSSSDTEFGYTFTALKSGKVRIYIDKNVAKQTNGHTLKNDLYVDVNIKEGLKDTVKPVCYFTLDTTNKVQVGKTIKLFLHCEDNNELRIKDLKFTENGKLLKNIKVTKIETLPSFAKQVNAEVTIKGLLVGNTSLQLKSGSVVDIYGNSNVDTVSPQIKVSLFK